MSLKLGELSVVLKTDERPLDDGLAAARVKTRAAGEGMQGDAATTAAGITREWGKGGRDAGDAFVRDSNGRLRDNRGRFAAEGSELGDALSGGLASGTQAATSGLSGLAGGLSDVAGPLGMAAKLISAVAAAATFAAPAIGVLGGALGSLPGIIGGLGALTGVLSLGFMGLGDAFKKTAGGGAGGAVVDRAYQIAQAERRVRDANEEVKASQENLTRTREKAAQAVQDLAEAEEDAKHKMEDLSRSLTGAKLDEERSQLRITEAQLAYQKALQNPADPLAIKEADLALREAQNSAVDAKARVDDLTQQKAESDAKGVMGSDEVKAAQDRLRDATDAVAEARKRERNATEGVADAEHALNEARKPQGGGGGGGAAKAITKLAPAAAAAVAAIKSLKPAFESLRLDIQERLFKGVGERIKDVAAAWLPTLHQRLGSMASILNGLFKNFTTSITKKSFINDISDGLKSFEGLVKRVGTALTGPFVDAWGRLSRAAGPFIGQLGKELAGVITKFSSWIKSADNSGKLEAFFKKASVFLHEIFTMGRTVASIIGGIFGAIFGGAQAGGQNDPLASFQQFLEKISVWVNNPENQKKIADLFTSITGYVKEALGFVEKLGIIVGPVFKLVGILIDQSAQKFKLLAKVAQSIGDAISWVAKNAPKWWNSVKNAAGAAKDWISNKWNQLLTWFNGLPGKISRAASGMWNGIKSSFKSTINWLIAAWNNLSFTIGGGSFLGMAIPSLRLDTPNIPYLAQGGIVPATPGGRLVGVGEGGEDEAVIPLSKLQEMFGRIVLELRSSGSELDDLLLQILRNAIKWRGGNVQVVLGQ